jgi:hypothetical protein
MEMKRVLLSFVVFLFVGVATFAAQAQDKETGMKASAVPQTPEWQKLRSLVGSWEGVMEEGGKKVPTMVEVRMTGDGSAIMHLMARDTPYEMVTMFHPDGKRLLAAPNQVAFDFVDGTNIAPGEGYMKSLVITFVDADHHEEAWTNSTGGAPAVFKYTRKK